VKLLLSAPPVPVTLVNAVGLASVLSFAYAAPTVALAALFSAMVAV